MAVVVLIIGGTVFLVSVGAHVWVRVKLKPTDPDLDEYYHEFEDQHPEVIRYNKWVQMTFMGACIGMLLLFLALVF